MNLVRHGPLDTAMSRDDDGTLVRLTVSVGVNADMICVAVLIDVC